RAARHVVAPEHEVIYEELRAPAEEIRERRAPLVGVEAILLVHAHPGQRLAPPGELVTEPRELLLGFQQLETRREPLVACSGRMRGLGSHDRRLRVDGES